MARFLYTAKSQPGQVIKGEVEAETQQEAINKISASGELPISVTLLDLSDGKKQFLDLAKVSKKEIAAFTQQLSSLMGSGINVLSSLNTIAQKSSNKYLKHVINDVIAKVKDGLSLSESLSTHPQVFSEVYASMIRSGEIGGSLEVTLKRLADYLETQEEFKNSLRQALAYPIFVFIFGIITVITLLVFVIPRLVTMFEDIGQALPLPTRALIFTSKILHSYWWIIIAAILIIIFTLKRLISTPNGRLGWDNLKLKTAIIGPIILKTELSRLTRTLSLLLSGGISILPSIESSAQVLENRVIKTAAGNLIKEVGSGLSLSRAMKNSKFFPDFVINIVNIGEETGSIDKSLLRISQDYEREVDATLKALTRLLEPVIILFMGLVVGFIVLSMLLPIFQMNLIVR